MFRKKGIGTRRLYFSEIVSALNRVVIFLVWAFVQVSLLFCLILKQGEG